MTLHCQGLGHHQALIVDRKVESSSYGIINPVYGTDTEHWIVFRCL
ncbi:MAG: hypothetical protein OXC68_08970 [Aestuariivita sp.]|nr:hypothetical protein [Aestuariivita sp.]